MKNNILTFTDVKLIYHTKQGETTAAEHLDFSVGKGEFVAIIGPSGCGKTTLLSLAAGLLKPSEGSVTSSAVLPSLRMIEETSSQTLSRV